MKKYIRKDLADLIHEAMNQHELAREFYQRMSHLVTHQDTRETFLYLAKEAAENKERLHKCLTPEGCPVAPPVQDAHLAELLQVPPFTQDMPPKEALALAVKRSEGIFRFYQSLAELQAPGDIRDHLEYLARAELSHKDKLEYLYDDVAFPEVW